MDNATVKGAEYRRNATACLELAKTVDANRRAALIEMARFWHEKAGEVRDTSAPTVAAGSEPFIQPPAARQLRDKDT